VTRVDVSRNLIHAKIYISVMPESETQQISEVLNQKIYDVQQRLNKRLKMRPIPKINFVVEKETAQAGKIEELLEEIKTKKNA